MACILPNARCEDQVKCSNSGRQAIFNIHARSMYSAALIRLSNNILNSQILFS